MDGPIQVSFSRLLKANRDVWFFGCIAFIIIFFGPLHCGVWLLYRG
jgi:hypothetical protein